MSEARVFPAWRTIRLGTHPTMAGYVAAIEASGGRVGTQAHGMLARVRLAGRPHSVELVKVTCFDVGLTGKYETPQIDQAAARHGLSLCPAEVGLALREQYLDQPQDEYLLIAMSPLASPNAIPSVFNVGYGGLGLLLSANRSRYHHTWDTYNQWVYLHRR